jgi:hypothetical protein
VLNILYLIRFLLLNDHHQLILCIIYFLLSAAIDQNNILAVNKEHIFILGDDQTNEYDVENGPHLTAFAIGKKLVIGCAHSLTLVLKGNSSTRTREEYQYNKEYWIQNVISKHINGSFSSDDRILLKLYKFHVENDWALFLRDDGLEFGYFPQIEILTTTATHAPANLLHCPVSLLHQMQYSQEFSLSCNISAVTIQNQSSHQLKYSGGSPCRESSGRALHLCNSNEVVGMHLEAVHEVDYEEAANPRTIPPSNKRTLSEDFPYTPFSLPSSAPPSKKQKNCDSETVASLAGGNDGLGSSLIISKFSR